MRSKERFAHNLRILMDRDGINGKQISESIGVKPSNISRWLSAIQWPDAIYLDHLAEVYGWRVEELFSETSAERAANSEISTRDAFEVLAERLGFKRPKLIKDDQ